MKKYEHIMIGFGKGAKTLAGTLAGAGKSVAIIEQSEQMYGGTCINVACIPTKALEFRARLGKNLGGDFPEKARRYEKAIVEKRKLTEMLRGKNYGKAVSAGVEVLVGKAAFADSHVLQIVKADGSVEKVYGEQIYINTGARPFIPDISGLKENRFVYTSESLMELSRLPENLVIIGAGYIGLEFSSYYANFGTKVTIIQDGEQFLPREDAEVAQVVLESLKQRGITVLRQTQILSVEEEKDGAVIEVKNSQGEYKLYAQAVLVATGRRPNVEGLQLEKAGVDLTQRGAVAVDEKLQTSVPGIWAMGDVTGGLQFTYISLDDSRIVKSQLLGDKSRTTKNRGEVPYSVFLDPPFSRVGMTEQQALEQGCKIKTAKLMAAAVPKAQVIMQPTGILKVIIDKETDLILGAHLFCAESHEVINQLKMVIDNKIPYTYFRDAVFTHPTMSEALNDLFASV